MKDPLLLSIKNFLEARLVLGKPLLLGCSGGPDSKALFYLLFEVCHFFSLELHVAHIDHGWREESREEAAALQKEVEDLKIPFHLQRLSSDAFSPGNLEEQARDLRLSFFSNLYEKYGCQALILGHHADDQAEVVLKRLFEGGSLFSLGGLAEEKDLAGMNIWRPFLGIPKQVILEWLQKRNISFFQDPTNLSPANLRGKMRQEILPTLSEMFGKEIAGSLWNLGKEAEELKTYFSSLNRPILDRLKRDEKGFSLDLAPFLPLPALQLRFLFKECFSREKIVLSRQILEEMVKTVLKGDKKKQFVTKQGKVEINCDCFCFYHSLKHCNSFVLN